MIRNVYNADIFAGKLAMMVGERFYSESLDDESKRPESLR